MKWIATLVLCLVLTGCATVPRKQAMSFDDAVRASLQTDPKYQVVLTMEEDGSVSIAGRPVAKEELKAIRSVAGLPRNPPGVLIRANWDANRSDVRGVMDELTGAGMWTIAVVSLTKEDLHNQAPEDTARKLADPQR